MPLGFQANLPPPQKKNTKNLLLPGINFTGWAAPVMKLLRHHPSSVAVPALRDLDLESALDEEKALGEEWPHGIRKKCKENTEMILK